MSTAWGTASRSILVVAALTLPVILACAMTREPDEPGVFVLPASVGDTLTEPLVLRAVPRQVGDDTINVLDITMEVVLDTVVLPGTPVTAVLRAYRLVAANGETHDVTGFPGPTLWASPGDSVRILLRNRLPLDEHMHSCYPYPASTGSAPRDTFPNCFHGLNTTNIHYHGSHITPDGSGDNVLLAIAPGDSFQYAFRFPLNQSPGTHWYHPHKHGSVAVQVVNGMAGAMIVEGGGLDSLVRAHDMKQHLVAVQQVDSTLNLIGTGIRAIPLVNGQVNPVVVMRQGEVQRWRLINENVSNTTTYAVLFGDAPGVAEPSLFDVARDGVQYDPANYDGVTPDRALVVAPGNRLDMFVKAPQDTGVHTLNRVLTGNVRAIHEMPQGVLAAATQALLTVYVIPDDGTVNTTLPAALPPLPAFLANLASTRDTAHFVVFGESGPRSNANPPSFFLGTNENPQQKFDPTGEPFISMPLGVTQTWKITNTSTFLNHPFHIHVNPFQIIHVAYDSTADAQNAPLYDQVNAAAARGAPLWFDTFPLPLTNGEGTPGHIVIRQQYADFTGRFVMHCHILGHEERGMMQLLQITPIDRGPPPGG
jgi:FtsP/CotA-like multicopper oxidase with cupredoxin domain